MSSKAKYLLTLSFVARSSVILMLSKILYLSSFPSRRKPQGEVTPHVELCSVRSHVFFILRNSASGALRTPCHELSREVPHCATLCSARFHQFPDLAKFSLLSFHLAHMTNFIASCHFALRALIFFPYLAIILG
ncbi:hypothetical protein HAX54_002172, partial [Datura stramonium]|nr:hypothetical protein [Datura stramonium]